MQLSPISKKKIKNGLLRDAASKRSLTSLTLAQVLLIWAWVSEFKKLGMRDAPVPFAKKGHTYVKKYSTKQ